MHKTTLYLEEEVYERLRQMADARSQSQASIIRDALATYVMPRRRKPRSIGMGRSGRRDLSERAESLLCGFGE